MLEIIFGYLAWDGKEPMNIKKGLTIFLVYLVVSVLILISGFVPLGKVSELSVSPTLISLVLLLPLFVWYKWYKRRTDLTSKLEVKKSFVWVEVIVLFLAAVAVRVPMVLILDMAYEKTAVIYLLVLAILLVKRNSLGAYGFRTEGFTRSLLVGLAYYLAFAVPFFITFFGLTYAYIKEVPITGYNPLTELFVFPFMTFCVGISEEGLFRGFMQTRLSKVHGERKALFAQALLFGIWHFVWYISPFNPFGMIIHIFSTFIFGLVFGQFYKESGNLIPLILTHGLVDTVGTGIIPNPKLEEMETLIQNLQIPSLVISMIVFVLCTKRLAKKARVKPN
jgi:hypothetical protein